MLSNQNKTNIQTAINTTALGQGITINKNSIDDARQIIETNMYPFQGCTMVRNIPGEPVTIKFIFKRLPYGHIIDETKLTEAALDIATETTDLIKEL